MMRFSKIVDCRYEVYLILIMSKLRGAGPLWNSLLLLVRVSMKFFSSPTTHDSQVYMYLISPYFLRLFFDVVHFSSLCWICYNVASVFCLFFWLRSLWYLSSPTRDWTCTPYPESEVLATGPPGKPSILFFKNSNSDQVTKLLLFI